jgi:D-arabinose 1-dehydrogenase-like Zn-dependent alcohol dehydrogenase
VLRRLRLVQEVSPSLAIVGRRAEQIDTRGEQMAKMRAVQVSEAGGAFELVERDVPEPGRGEALVRVHACGICHSDSFAKDGGFPGVSHPLVPGHEIAGAIESLGEGVKGWQVGQRVGVGWFGGNCGYCEPCRRGDFINCQNMEIPGITIDGGYADYVVVKAGALALVPSELSDVEAAPLMCAGITTYNALRHSGAHGGDVVAVIGLGGLGHLAVQFAAKLGFRTVAIARGAQKGELARKLGAHHYIDSTAENPAQELSKLGGASAILSTVTSSSAIDAAFGGLAARGRLVILGASMEPMQIPPAALIGGSTSIVGHASGSSRDSEDTLSFSVLAGVRPMIETLPLERTGEAYEKMISGDARFRMVLTTAA